MATVQRFANMGIVLLLTGCGPLHDLSDMHDDMKGLRVDIKSMSDKLSDTNTQITGMGTQLTDTNKSITGMAGQLTDTNQSITKMSDQFTETNQGLKTMSGQLGETNSTMKVMATTMVDMDAGLKTMGADLKGMRTEFTSLHADIKSMLGDIGIMAGQMTTLNKVIIVMSSDMKTMSADVSHMSGQMTLMAFNIDRMYTTMSGMADGVKSMLAQMGDMNQSIKDMHADMGGLLTYIQTMSGQMDSMNAAIGKMYDSMKLMGSDVHLMTAQMQNIAEMNQKLGQVVNTMGGMKTDLGQMYGGMRMVLAKQSRVDALACLDEVPVSDKSTLDQINFFNPPMLQLLKGVMSGQQNKGKFGSQQSRKFACASEYFGSFEYQSWTPAIDAESDRQKMMKLAVMEFFTKTNLYWPNTNDLRVTYTNSTSQSLYALVVGLNFVNDLEVNNVGSKYPVVSMLSMFETSLHDHQLVLKGQKKSSDVQPYELEVWKYEPVARYLIQLRSDFLKAIALALITKEKSGNDSWVFPESVPMMGGATREIVFQTMLSHYLSFLPDRWSGSLTNWSGDFEGKNVAQIQMMTQMLDWAGQDENFLTKNGIPVRMDTQIGDLLAHLHPNFSKVAVGSDASAQAQEKLFVDTLHWVVTLDQENWGR